MIATRLGGLSVRIWAAASADDIALIFAEPSRKDLDLLIAEDYIRDVVNSLLLGHTWHSYKEELFPTESKETLLNGAAKSEDPLAEDDNEDDNRDEDMSGEDEEDLKSEANESEEARASQPYLPIKQVGPDKFLCLVCQKTINNKSNARKHVKTHGIGLEPLESRTCPHCSKVFDYAALCRKHVKRTCKLMQEARCSQCEQVFESGPALKEHLKTSHDVEKFKCSFCDHVASTVQNKVTHEKRIHLGMDCKACKKLFINEAEKQEHVCAEPDRYKCHQCEKSYKAKGELRNHVMVVHEGLRYPCPDCQEVLSSVQALKRHQKSFHFGAPKDHVCQICNQAFTHRDTWKKHVLTHDRVMRSDPCPYCGKVLRNKDVMRQHIKTLHEKNFSVVCEDCGQKFANKHRLEIHNEMAHFKGKQFVCQLCGKDFLGRRRLHNHMLSKHPKGQKFVTCDYCGQEVGEKQLRSHIVEAHKAHTYKYQCEHCQKRFPVKGHIKRHIRVHTGARPYLCRGCGSYFVDLEAVKDHIRKAHEGDVGLAHYDIAKDVNNPYA